MDQGHIYLALVQDKSGIKSLIGADIFSATKAKLDPKRNPTGFSVALGKAYEQLTTKLEKKGSKVPRSITKKLHADTLEHMDLIDGRTGVPSPAAADGAAAPGGGAGVATPPALF